RGSGRGAGARAGPGHRGAWSDDGPAPVPCAGFSVQVRTPSWKRRGTTGETGMAPHATGGNGRRQRPASVVVRIGRWPHRLDLREIDRAYYRGLVEGRWTLLGDLADAANLSRSTVSRFLSGSGASVHTARAIFDVLGVRFDDVARRCDDEPPPA